MVYVYIYSSVTLLHTITYLALSAQYGQQFCSVDPTL